MSSTDVTAQMLDGPEGAPIRVGQGQHPAAVHEDGLVARRHRHLPGASDSVIDLDDGHQASRVDHVPIMPLDSMARVFPLSDRLLEVWSPFAFVCRHSWGWPRVEPWAHFGPRKACADEDDDLPAIGGPRDLALQGKTAADVIKTQDRNLREAVRSGDAADEPAHEETKRRWRRPIAAMGWYRDTKSVPEATGQPVFCLTGQRRFSWRVLAPASGVGAEVGPPYNAGQPGGALGPGEALSARSRIR